MAFEIQVLQGAAFAQRYSSTRDGEPFNQGGRTLRFELWRGWGTDDAELVLEIVTSEDDPDPRLVPLDHAETPDPENEGKWELDLGASDTNLEPGMYRWSCSSVDDEDLEDVAWLVPPCDFWVQATSP